MKKQVVKRVPTVVDKLTNDEIMMVVVENFEMDDLTTDFIAEFSGRNPRQFQFTQGCTMKGVEIDAATFLVTTSFQEEYPVFVAVHRQDKQLMLTCDCAHDEESFCLHQAIALSKIADSDLIQLYFFKEKRQTAFKRSAQLYGLEKEKDLDRYFELKVNRGTVAVEPKLKEIPRFDEKGRKKFDKLLLPNKPTFEEGIQGLEAANKIRGLIFSENHYHEQLTLELFEAPLAKNGEPKNPFRSLNLPLEMQKTEEIQELKFYSAVAYFGNNSVGIREDVEQLRLLKQIVKNPLKIHFYLNVKDKNRLTNTSKTIVLEFYYSVNFYISLNVKQKQDFFEVIPFLNVNDRKIKLDELKLHSRLLVEFEKKFFLFNTIEQYNLYRFFKEHGNRLLVPKEKFEEFSANYLVHLEEKIQIDYSFKKPATKKQAKEFLTKNEPEKTIYLAESENYILITPAIRYGKMEVPILSSKQLSAIDEVGEWFVVQRDTKMEDRIIGLLLRQHAYFEEQMGSFEHFYLHKHHFFGDGWFVQAFDEWQRMGITVLGFKELKNNKWNPSKIEVKIAVSSQTDWFETSVKISYNKQQVSLQQVQRAIRNQQNYVTLGDGTQGLLPEEWMAKFSRYFRAGDLIDETIRTSKLNYSAILDLFEEENIDTEILKEIEDIEFKINNFNNVKSRFIPKSLNGTLRDYQQEGLNWLHFLDEFNFGGCLADDMGLGKTIQIISFILSLKEQNGQRTHLVVVPTSLLFNWQREVEKFAPTLTLHTNYGTSRSKNTVTFAQYDIILTTYGTLLSDIHQLKKFSFDYIFLDESQAIKNPDSMRYKAARLLQSRNRLVLTGTPIENNTFDLFAQFSFAIPGLFGSQKRFKEEYSIPIDKFKDAGRAQELQNRISPFLLRRTKKQVARELPDKTEIVLQCEMGEEQRKVYEAFKNEIRESLLSRDTVEYDSNKSILLLQGLMKLRQICNSPKLLPEDVDYGAESAKIDVLMREIKARYKHHKILIFSQFVSMLDLIRAELDRAEISHEYLTGKSKNREDIVHRFQNDEEVRVFLISLKAGGTGLNLTEADYVYIVDPWWNPAVENQAIDRCYRIGQKKNVVAVRLICPNTIEEKIMLLQESKRELADDLVRTDASILKSIDKEVLISLFS